MMDAINFACFFERFQKSLGYTIDSEIVGNIFEYYDTYDNYTLPELIYTLDKKRIKIDCEYNKKAIVEMIKSKKINIPTKNGPIQHSEWYQYYDRPYIEYSRRNIIKIKKYGLSFMHNDVFKIDGVEWMIDDIEAQDEETDGDYDKVYVHCIDCETQSESRCIEANDFIYMVDHDDFTIVASFDRYIISKYIKYL